MQMQINCLKFIQHVREGKQRGEGSASEVRKARLMPSSAIAKRCDLGQVTLPP